MKRKVSVVLTLMLLVTLMVTPIASANTIIYETATRQKVTKGLEYEYKQIFTRDGWVDLHVLLMDMNEEQVAMEILRSYDTFGLRQTMTNLAEEYDENNEGQVVAGVNGSFFNMSVSESDPLGITYEDGYVYANEGYNMLGNGAGTLIETVDGNVMFDFFGIGISLTTSEGNALTIDGINKLALQDLPVIYNELFGEDTSGINELGSFYQIVVENDKVVDVLEPGSVTDMPKEEDGYVIALPESIAEVHLPNFIEGVGINLTINSTIDTEDIKYAISGGGKLLENGEVVLDGFVVEPNSRHPRTAIGVTADQSTMVAMVVDGRNGSIGANHDELAMYLQQYGVSDAIHFDGGGSSTMLGRELGIDEVEVFNSPSGGGQRSVLNGIGFVSLAPVGQVAEIKILTSSDTVFKNNPIYLDVIGYDDNYNPVAIDTGKIVWSADDLDGDWETNTFIPTEAGDGVINCYYAGLVTETDIKSLDTAIDLKVEPKILSLDYNKTGSFTITGMDNNGFEGNINPKDVEYIVEDKEIGAFIEGEFYSGTKTGVSKVKIQVGDRWTTVYVAVGSEEATLEAFESASYYERSYPEEVIGAISKDTELKTDTDFSYKFDYEFVSSPDPQAFYMMLEDFYIHDSTDTISLQVYGNNSGHMLKGKLIDANGTIESVTFSSDINFDGWKELTYELSDNLTFPVQLDRIYVVNIATIGDYKGTINIDEMKVMSRVDVSDLKFDDEGFIADELRVEFPKSDYTKVSIFGATAYRNRLLDNILLEKVYEVMNEADVAIYAGRTDVHEDRISGDYHLWENDYQEYSYEGVRFVHVGTNSGGIRATDYTQYDKINETLTNATENTIVFIGNRDPFSNFSDDREGELFHSILKDYYDKTGKTIIYIYGGGYETGVTIKDGIRYFDLSGLWYTIEDRYVDLNTTFYTLDFYVKNGKFEYMFSPLYPVVEIVEE